MSLATARKVVYDTDIYIRAIQFGTASHEYNLLQSSLPSTYLSSVVSACPTPFFAQEMVVKSLAKNLRLRNLQDAETGYQTLQWIYSLDVKPTVPGIQNMQRFLALTNPKVKFVRTEDVVDDAPWQRLEKSPFYRELVATKK